MGAFELSHHESPPANGGHPHDCKKQPDREVPELDGEGAGLEVDGDGLGLGKGPDVGDGLGPVAVKVEPISPTAAFEKRT